METSNQINAPWWNKEKDSQLKDSQSLKKTQIEPQLKLSQGGPSYSQALYRHQPTD